MNGKINIATGWPANIMRNWFSLTTERRGSVCVSCVLARLWFTFICFINETYFSFCFLSVYTHRYQGVHRPGSDPMIRSQLDSSEYRCEQLQQMFVNAPSVSTGPTTEPVNSTSPDSLNKCSDFKSCLMRRNFVKRLRQILNHWRLLVNSAVNQNIKLTINSTSPDSLNKSANFRSC